MPQTPDSYKTITNTAQAEFKDRGSRFIAFAFPVQSADDIKRCLQQLKKDHPKAVHHCFAYRLGTEGQQYRANDDGEPAGTAGKPILGQIDSKQLTDTLVVVVRYFGGTLLGVPGLINAYKTATALVLQLVPLVQKAVMVPVIIDFDHAQMNEIMRQIKAFQVLVLQQEINLFCRVNVHVPKANFDAFMENIGEIRGVTITVKGS